MRLTPKRPPGRCTRKARAFEDEIARLRADGYTCAAIREALADVGVNVSSSTVQREVARHARRRAPAAAAVVVPLAQPAPAPLQTVASVNEPNLPPSEPPRKHLRGEDIAQAFLDKRISNAVHRSRTQEQP